MQAGCSEICVVRCIGLVALLNMRDSYSVAFQVNVVWTSAHYVESVRIRHCHNDFANPLQIPAPFGFARKKILSVNWNVQHNVGLLSEIKQMKCFWCGMDGETPVWQSRLCLGHHSSRTVAALGRPCTHTRPTGYLAY